MLAELNAIRASAELSRNGKFTFTGTNQGRINTVPAVYVWGIDRNGNLPPGPFTNRPNIKFDAVVIVTLGPTRHLTAEVVDLAHGNSTNLPSGSARIKGSICHGPVEPTPLHGPADLAVPLQLLAGGWRSTSFVFRGELRTRVYHCAGGNNGMITSPPGRSRRLP